MPSPGEDRTGWTEPAIRFPSPIGGAVEPVTTHRQTHAQRQMRMHSDRVDEVREARPDDLELSLVWDEDDEGGLVGQLRARNITAMPVRLSGKPGLRPLGEDGAPLATDMVVTAEFRSPGYAEIGPGEQASAPVGWAGWHGPPAGGQVAIRLSGGDVIVATSGPFQPTRWGPPTNLWSSWFDLVPATPT
jgi:uncharacterized protein DUF4232